MIVFFSNSDLYVFILECQTSGMRGSDTQEYTSGSWVEWGWVGVFGFGRLGVREWTGGVGWPVRRLGSISSSAEMGDSI